MKNTRERILEVALEQFARYGYDATSVQDIASVLGITKGALYRHYASKRAIFEDILRRMEQQDREQAISNDVPADAYAESPGAYKAATMENICAFSLSMFEYWTKDPFASSFRHMLALERYRDAEMMMLYQNYLCAGPLDYVQNMFAEMADSFDWKREDAASMALEFYGPMYLMLDAVDAATETDDRIDCLKAHFYRFMKKYANRS